MKNLADQLFVTDSVLLREAGDFARELDTDEVITGEISIRWVPDTDSKGYDLFMHINKLADDQEWYALFELANYVDSLLEMPLAA